MTWFNWILLTFCRGLCRLLYRHKVYGLEHVYHGGAIIVPNHVSYLDPPLIAVSWPQPLAFLARKPLFSKPFLGTAIRKLNAYPISGTGADVTSLKVIADLLHHDHQVVIFPEGMRSWDGRLGHIKSGIAMIAMRNECTLIPAYIYGAYKIWPRTRSFPRLWGKTACVFGSAIDPKKYSHLPKKEAQQAISEEVRNSIENLRLWYEAGAEGIPP
jgi:1-acyl-sn-glycerol-3-phosphate acyltransferase